MTLDTIVSLGCIFGPALGFWLGQDWRSRQPVAVRITLLPVDKGAVLSRVAGIRVYTFGGGDEEVVLDDALWMLTAPATVRVNLGDDRGSVVVRRNGEGA